MAERIEKSPYVIEVGDGMSPILQLMKKKWGITKSSPLTFTKNDYLYTAYRKLARNIFKNGEWTEEDKVEAVRDLFSEAQFKDPQTMGVRKLSDEEVTTLQSQVGHGVVFSKEKDVFFVNVVQVLLNDKEVRKNQYVILDPENKNESKDEGVLKYYSPSILQEHFRENNMNLTIGFSRIKRDISSYYKTLPESKQKTLTPKEIEKFFYTLKNNKKSGKSRRYAFERDTDGDYTPEILSTFEKSTDKYENETNRPWIKKENGFSHFIYPERVAWARRHNEVIDFFQGYIEDTYNIVLQNEYQKDQDKQLKASPWENKKNINASTLKRMETSLLNQHFSAVEFDNSVDLNALSVFEEEMLKIQTILPDNTNKGQSPELHLRMLGNYRASGMYVPRGMTLPSGAIVLDFRNGITDGTENAVQRLKHGGIRSFIHEYGHSLDFANGELSLQEEFSEIVTAYRRGFDKVVTSEALKKMRNYFQTPTEVFARAFELYASEARLSSLLIKDPLYYQDAQEYQAFSSEMRENLYKFFDKEFPQFKEKIAKYNQKEIQITPDKLKVTPLTNEGKKGENCVECRKETREMTNEIEVKASEKKTKRQEQDEIVQDLEIQAKEYLRKVVATVENLNDFMIDMAQFPALSPRNLALVKNQMPEATLIGDFSQFERLGKKAWLHPQDVNSVTRTLHVRGHEPVSNEISYLTITPGERSKISIIEKQADHFFLIQQANGTQIRHWEKYWNEDEKALVKSGKIKAEPVTYNVPKKVFDVSQTNIKEESLDRILPNIEIPMNDSKLRNAYEAGINNLYKVAGINHDPSDVELFNYFKMNQKAKLTPEEAKFASSITKVHYKSFTVFDAAQLVGKKFVEEYQTALIGKTESEINRSLTRVQREVNSAVMIIDQSVKPEYFKQQAIRRSEQRIAQATTKQISEPTLVR